MYAEDTSITVGGQLGLHNRGAREVLAAPDKVPEKADRAEAGKDGTGVVHRGRSQTRQNRRHAEYNYRQHNPGQGDDVDCVAKLAEREGGVLEGPPAAHDGDQDGQGVGGAQADGGDAGKAVEGGGRAEIDEAEQTVHREGEGEPPQGDVQPLVDLAPQHRAGDGAVARKGVRAPARGSQRADAREQPDSEDEEKHSESASRTARGSFEDQADGLSAGDVQEGLHVRQDEKDGDEEEKAREAGRDNGQDDSLGDLSLGVLHLLAHRCHHSVARQYVGRLQQAHEEGPPGRPPGA